ncbi:hypothetical protein [Prochlorothrix hollandica]|uniref:hypothetical protein n=1 Tax=Prochlorothrix hollandica TaxID=1223 RepID=UPI003341FE9C
MQWITKGCWKKVTGKSYWKKGCWKKGAEKSYWKKGAGKRVLKKVTGKRVLKKVTGKRVLDPGKTGVSTAAGTGGMAESHAMEVDQP